MFDIVFMALQDNVLLFELLINQYQRYFICRWYIIATTMTINLFSIGIHHDFIFFDANFMMVYVAVDIVYYILEVFY